MKKILMMSDIMSENSVVDGQFEDAEESFPTQDDGVTKAEKEEGGEGDKEEEGGEENDYEETENDQLDFMEWNDNKNMTNQYLKFAGKISMGTNPQCSQFKQSLLKMGQDKIYLGLYSGASFRKTDNYSEQRRDKSDRATLEKALNRSTLMLLYKMLNKIYTGIDGCVSTGKEANVYHATALDGHSLAVKVFKTVTTEFRNRSKYMQGEFRFKFNSCTKNISKLVPKWVEKEFRNLHRIYKAGIPSPEPICMNKNVLVMSFIGTHGRPAQKLKDVEMGVEEAVEMYVRCVVIMRTMFQQCKLVHADLSQFNLLVHEGKLYVIDVSQSLEMDNPSAMQFLHADIVNVTSFFRRQQVNTMTHRQLKSFIVEEKLGGGDDDDAYVSSQMQKAAEGSYSEEDDELREESTQEKLMNPFFNHLAMSQPVNDENLTEDESEESMSEDGEGEGNEDDTTGIYTRHKRESLEDKKARKRVVKEMQRQKRTHKIPKSEKKRRVKMSKCKK